MPPPTYFIPLVYLHLLAGTGVTFASSQRPLGQGLAYKIGTFVAVFVALFALFALSPGPLKYGVAVLFCALLGQTMATFVQTLDRKNLLTQTLVNTMGVFTAMTLVGFADNQNLLGFGGYLLAALLGLVVARFATLFFPHKTATDTTLSWLGVGIFTVYVAYDTQRLKADAKRNNKRTPDYVNSSLGLYLDFLNLFQNIGSLSDS